MIAILIVSGIFILFNYFCFVAMKFIYNYFVLQKERYARKGIPQNGGFLENKETIKQHWLNATVLYMCSSAAMFAVLMGTNGGIPGVMHSILDTWARWSLNITLTLGLLHYFAYRKNNTGWPLLVLFIAPTSMAFHLYGIFNTFFKIGNTDFFILLSLYMETLINVIGIYWWLHVKNLYNLNVELTRKEAEAEAQA